MSHVGAHIWRTALAIGRYLRILSPFASPSKNPAAGKSSCQSDCLGCQSEVVKRGKLFSKCLCSSRQVVSKMGFARDLAHVLHFFEIWSRVKVCACVVGLHDVAPPILARTDGSAMRCFGIRTLFFLPYRWQLRAHVATHFPTGVQSGGECWV
jgi:hypothetical protein